MIDVLVKRLSPEITEAASTEEKEEWSKCIIVKSVALILHTKHKKYLVIRFYVCIVNSIKCISYLI